MDYLLKYKDGYIIAASGDSPHEAMADAAAVTTRAEDEIDQITERHSTAVVYDCTRGWLARRKGVRKLDDLVDINTGELVGVKLANPPVEGVELPKVPDGFTPLVDDPNAAATDVDEPAAPATEP